MSRGENSKKKEGENESKIWENSRDRFVCMVLNI